MMRWMCKSKIHRATITEAHLSYEGSISIDNDLLEAADIVPYEMVQIYNVNNGARFETYAIPADKRSGVICLNGAAARLGMVGDKIIIVSSAWIEEKDVPAFSPKVVFVNDRNQRSEKSSLPVSQHHPHNKKK
jgi:aspartate 1-decarboxylase